MRVRQDVASPAAAVVAALLLAACGGPRGRPAGRTPSRGTASAPTAPTVPTPPAGTSGPLAPTGTAPPAGTQPLALAYSVHRPPLDLTRAEADRLAAGRAGTGRRLGRPGGAVGRRTHGAGGGRAGAPGRPAAAGPAR